jgi:hypothetical protein
MSHIIEKFPRRPALGGRVRNSLEHALSHAVLVETLAAHALLEWVNFLDEGMDEIQEVRHRHLLDRRSEEDCSTQHASAPQLPGTEGAGQQIRFIGWELQEIAHVVQHTLGNCYRSYNELSEILDTYKNPRDARSKLPTASP